MIEKAYDNNSFGDITELDLEKIISIYGTEGFEKKCSLHYYLDDNNTCKAVPSLQLSIQPEKEIGFFEWLMSVLGF